MNKTELISRRTKTIVTMLVFTIMYFLFTDPDLGIVSNLPFGSSLVLITEIVVVSMLGILISEILADVFLDDIIGDEKELVKKALEGNKEAAMIFIGKSIRVFSAGVIVACTIIGFTS